MSDTGYLEYPERRLGYDHQLYQWEILFDREPKAPGKLAVIPVVPVQWFPFKRGAAFPPMGAPSKEHPDYREWSWKDYGARVGIFRILATLNSAGATPTIAIDAESCRRYPRIVEEIGRQNLDVVAHGVSAADVHHDGLEIDAERALIDESVTTVRDATGRTVDGWLSPSRSTSRNTHQLLAGAGISYTLDWANDDLPYPLSTTESTVTSLPLSHELHDVNSIWQLRHTAPEWADQVRDSVSMLAAEAAESGNRTLGLILTPWLLGQAHRVPSLRRALAAVTETPGASWASMQQALRSPRAAAS